MSQAESCGSPLKLLLGCGQQRLEGWTGVDAVPTPAVDVLHDLAVAPWPWEDGEVEEAQANHVLEHLTGRQRMVFMDELWRVLAPGGRATIVCPYWTSMRAVQDPTHEWPPVAEASFLYWNRAWREANGLGHYPLVCNFGFTYGYVLPPQWANRHEEARAFAIGQYVNAVSDLQVVLTKES